jgi:ketosteroid isomerase-like protein
MKAFSACLTFALVIAAAASASAQTVPVAPHQVPPGQVMPSATLDVPSSAAAAAAAVAAFGKALSSGNLKAAEALLDPDVIILESGSAERSRAEYLGQHAKEDAKFLADAQVVLKRRTARADGAGAWVASESEIQAKHDGIPMTLISTETMVLKKIGPDWRIVHIHWSSRPKDN